MAYTDSREHDWIIKTLGNRLGELVSRYVGAPWVSKEESANRKQFSEEVATDLSSGHTGVVAKAVEALLIATELKAQQIAEANVPWDHLP